MDKNDAQAYLDRGRSHLSICEFDKAIADYEKAIRIDPEDNQYAKSYISDTLLERGDTYLEKGEFDKAIADYDRAIISLNTDHSSIFVIPNYTSVYIRRGIAYMRIGEHDRAITDFNHIKEFLDEYNTTRFGPHE